MHNLSRDARDNETPRAGSYVVQRTLANTPPHSLLLFSARYNKRAAPFRTQAVCSSEVSSCHLSPWSACPSSVCEKCHAHGDFRTALFCPQNLSCFINGSRLTRLVQAPEKHSDDWRPLQAVLPILTPLAFRLAD